MRPIDADVLKQHIDKLPALPDGNFAGNHSALKALINMQPTIEPSTNCSEFPNNSDAVSRQAAIDALDKRFDNIPMEQTAEILMLRKDLRELPAVQAELLDGEWVRIADLWRCNKCGCRIDLKNPLDGNIWNYYFCPHCGTKMNIAVQRF